MVIRGGASDGIAPIKGGGESPDRVVIYPITPHILFLASLIRIMIFQPNFPTSNRKRPGGTSNKKKHPHPKSTNEEIVCELVSQK